MIDSEKQRRWWFANHPEYSSSRRGAKRQERAAQGHLGDKVSPEEVDDYVDHALQYADGPLAVFLESIKRNLGTEGNVPKPTMLAGSIFTPVDGVWGPHKLQGGGGGGAGRGIRASGSGSSRGGGGTSRGGGGGARRGGTAKTRRSSASSDEGPGQWVEVKRGDKGMEHQSKMSGQPIVKRADGLYIREYEVNGTKFDDYKDGKLYEYKGRQGNLKNKQGLFPEWAKLKQEARDQAASQVRAARGIPIIWRVGADQVKAFDETLGHLPGIEIVP